jgi:hypothetical protein
LLGAVAIDVALDVEQYVDALDRFQRDWRDRRRILPAPSIGGDVCQLEELPSRMSPTECGDDRSLRARRIVQLVVAVVRVGLQYAGEAVKVPHGMFVPAIARSVIERRRRRASPERPVIAYIGPDAPLDRFALSQDRHGRVVAVQPLGRQDVALD